MPISPVRISPFDPPSAGIDTIERRGEQLQRLLNVRIRYSWLMLHVRECTRITQDDEEPTQRRRDSLPEQLCEEAVCFPRWIEFPPWECQGRKHPIKHFLERKRCELHAHSYTAPQPLVLLAPLKERGKANEQAIAAHHIEEGTQQVQASVVEPVRLVKHHQAKVLEARRGCKVLQPARSPHGQYWLSKRIRQLADEGAGSRARRDADRN